MRSFAIGLLVLGLSLTGCAAVLGGHRPARERLQWAFDGLPSIDFVRVRRGALHAPCSIRSPDGRIDLPSGEFDAPALPEWAIGFSSKKDANEFAETDWTDNYPFALGHTVELTCGEERFNGRLYLAALPRKFAGTAALRYDIEIGEAAFKAARDGFLGFSVGAHRWGWANVPVRDRITWMLIFSKSPLPEPNKVTGEVAQDARRTELWIP